MSHRPAMLAALLLTAALCLGCADNATSLSREVGVAAARLTAGRDSSLSTSFAPVHRSDSPYTVIFFPAREVPEGDLVTAGVDKAIARRIYSELAYLGTLAGVLLVEQEGERISFTTSWKQFANVQPPDNLVVSPRTTGPLTIELRRREGIVRIAAMR